MFLNIYALVFTTILLKVIEVRSLQLTFSKCFFYLDGFYNDYMSAEHRAKTYPERFIKL